MGGYEPNPKPWAATRCRPGPFEFSSSATTRSFRADHGAGARPRAGARRPPASSQLINGPESFTPDGNFILGEAPETQAASSSAPASTRSASRRAAAPAWRWPNGWRKEFAALRSLACRYPPLRPKNTRTAPGSTHAHAGSLRQALHHGLAVRGASVRPAAAPLAALSDRLKAQGAVFGEKLGWERPNWFAGPGDAAGRPLHLRPAELVRRRSGASIVACRERAVLFDQTSFAKFELRGPRRRDVALVLALRQSTMSKKPSVQL